MPYRFLAVIEAQGVNDLGAALEKLRMADESMRSDGVPAKRATLKDLYDLQRDCLRMHDTGPALVLLSNGHSVLLDERKDGLHLALASEDARFARYVSDVEAWVASITPGGVLVYPNSGTACEWIANGLNPSD